MAFVSTTPFVRNRASLFSTTSPRRRTTYFLISTRTTNYDWRRALVSAKLSRNQRDSVTPVKTEKLSISSTASPTRPQELVHSERLPQQGPSTSDRLFSNIAPSDDGILVRKKPSELAATALIAVCHVDFFFCIFVVMHACSESGKDKWRRF